MITLADENYALPLAVTGRSLFDNLGVDRSISLTVIDGGLAAHTRERLLASWDIRHSSVEFVPPFFGGSTTLPVWGRMSLLTYARLFVPAYVPPTCSRAIFLDSDLLVLEDLGRLWDVPTGGSHVLAVQDPAVPFVSSRDGLARYRDLGIAPRTPYFNAGVMVVDLDKWRSDEIPSAAMRFVLTYGHELNYCDQDALNAVLIGRWRPLDPRWQVQPRFVSNPRLPLPHMRAATREALVDGAWIFHFSGRLKPWAYRGNSPADRLFVEYLERTWWRDRKPRRGARSLLLRSYDSRLRGWCYPIEQRTLSWLRRRRRRLDSVSESSRPTGAAGGQHERRSSSPAPNKP